MFVASRVESGDGDRAVVALFPQSIGDIQTAIGCGTIRRAGGIAVQVTVGDAVFQGDVIETAADGRIGIRFIDGTVFNLSGGTCVALNEFVCDGNGTSQSILFGVTRGIFAFIAGKVAKTGCLQVETSVGSIRGRAHSGGIGMLSLAALTFSMMMKEVQAADPNVTFLDDGSITYKDLEHGAFELVTKEAIPRHIFVEDPGETIVLHPRGSAVSVNQITNSVTRMAELREVQQDALATFAKGLGTNGSSTPPFVKTLSVQPINFIENHDSPALNSPIPVPWINIPVLEIITVRPPPTLHAAAGPIEIDTAAFDDFTATSGTFSASSPNSVATLTFGISGGAAGSTLLSGVTYDVSNIGPYGTLYVNSTTGAYAFVPDSGAINALKTATVASFTVTVSDGTLSANQAFTIDINGTNDAAIISGTATGPVIEAGGAANAASGTPTTTGTLTDVDVDDTANTFTAVSSPTASTGGHGTFTMTAAGVWTYTLNEANGAVQALNVGDTLIDTFTVTTVDGTAQVVTITISGSNDAAIISGATTGSVIEAGCVAHAAPGTLIATGMLTDTDVDNAPNLFMAVAAPTASASGHGSFTMTAAGVWTYTLNDADSAVQRLNVGDTLIDTFTVATVDGTAQVVTITIHGSNDAAIISGTTTGSVIEAGGVANAKPGTPTATGTLTDIDIDNALNVFTAISSPATSAGGYGTFTMTAGGVWTYTLNNANSAVQALNVCDTLTDTFTVTTVDGTAQVITVTINGSNDAAIISGTATGSVIEAGGATCGTPTATGTLTDIDVDNTPNTFTAVDCPTLSACGYGTLTMTAAGVWTYTLDNANCAVQALDTGDTLTDSFTVKTVDGTAKAVTITINGSDDADPNDFDALATGTRVRSDPPYVYGTRGDDTIARGGDHGQIIYGGAGDDTIKGTCSCDLIYGGSGNDGLKGDDGDDTIYGGSGSDTINGNNGCDTIVGGYGADDLTGGHGDDRFVYLSRADSNAVLFDTISDFTCGSDRIDLTAFGALDFAGLALTSTHASVPAHTTAQFNDSSTHQTIVYVNPTDQVLGIGNVGLLEIHLQGISTVATSDFVLAPTTAHAGIAGEPINSELAATAENDGAVVAMTIADGSGTVPTTDVGSSFDAARDQIDLMGDARFTSFGEVRPHSTEDANNNVVSLASGQSIALQRVHVTTPMDNFAFAPDNAAAPAGGGQHVHATEALWAGRGNQAISSDASGDGGATRHGAGVLDSESFSTANMVSGSRAAGTHGLGDSFHFNAEISNFKGSDVIGPADAGLLAISEEAHTIVLSLLAQHSADNFSVVPDLAGTVVIHVPHDLIV
jgi:VCBS repeat-containing protein